MKKIAIIQARMGSSRLPGKVMMNLEGKPVLSWIVNAAKRISNIDDVIIATTDKGRDDKIISWCSENNIQYYRGSEDNVLERYYGTAKSLNLMQDDIIMRLTADCPLLDPQVCGEVVSFLIRTGKDYVNNIGNPRLWPDGLDCEVFKFSALEKSIKEAHEDKYKEHVTLYIREKTNIFDTISLSCPIGGIGKYRWTLDTKEDFEHIKTLVKHLIQENGSLSFSYNDILKIEEKLNPQPLGNVNGVNNSLLHLKRALKSIPSASQTFSKSYIHHIAGISPFFIDRGKGAYIWDIDNNKYIDYMSALLPILLGYGDNDVDEAIKSQLAKGISFSLSTELEAELSEMLIDLIPCAEMVRFNKNGSDVTSAAIRLARAYTGRNQIAICGYHGWHDWYIGTTPRNLGVPDETIKLTDKFIFNDIESLKTLLSQKKYAAIILEAEGVSKSSNNFLEDIRKLATDHGAILVFDEIVSGFRSSYGGVQKLRGIIPDLSCFGKAMGNGMPISALVGKKDIMSVMDKVFVSSTFGGEALSIAATIACLKKYIAIDGVNKINSHGKMLKAEINNIIFANGIENIISIKGQDWWPAIDVNHSNEDIIRVLIRQELARYGIIQGNSFNISTSHYNDSVFNQTIDIWCKVVKSMQNYLNSKDLSKHLSSNQQQKLFKVR